MIFAIVLYILKMTYYKVSEEDLLQLYRDACDLDSIKQYVQDWKIEFQEAFDDISDEELLEAINSCYEIID